jgi:hypothetical protein
MSLSSPSALRADSVQIETLNIGDTDEAWKTVSSIRYQLGDLGDKVLTRNRCAIINSVDTRLEP